MADDLVLIGLVLIFVQEVLSPGESDLVDVLLHFLLCHTDTVVCDGDGLVRRIHGHLNLILHILRLLKLPHQLQLL